MKSFSFVMCIAWIRKSHQPTHQHLVLAYTLETFLLSFISASQRNHTLHFTILEKCFCFSSAFFHAEMIDVLCRLHSLIDEEELLVLDTCSTSFTNGLIHASLPTIYLSDDFAIHLAFARVFWPDRYHARWAFGYWFLMLILMLMLMYADKWQSHLSLKISNKDNNKFEKEEARRTILCFSKLKTCQKMK